jgi:glycyl-tRNA synthetase beta chain
MADLLLELFSEEIPARMQADALAHLRSALTEKLLKEGVTTSVAGEFVTPRRIAVWLKDLPLAQAASEIEIKGPKVGAPDAAMQGFLKKSGLAQSDLVERDGVYFATVKKEGRDTAVLLKTIIEEILSSFPWPKSMRWPVFAALEQVKNSADPTWVRPLHSMICLFDGNIIPIAFAGITAGNTTHGHRFLSTGTITITDVSEYESKLKESFVIADRNKRKMEIQTQAQTIIATGGWKLANDNALLEEVTGLVEYPVVLAGKIDAKFMDLPKEVLISEMRAHQKYFALENTDGTLSDTFLITANIKTDDGAKAIIAGNERVLRARLSDGRFFWDQDRKKSLEQWAHGLESVTYHAKLGSISDKVERTKVLALQVAEYIKADKKLVERSANLCKADLVTGMVGEFPELQGIMGRYYAMAQKESPEIANAIADHYKPQGPTDSVPTAAVSICVALADKLDTLISLFAIGEKPTGSKDPFALRRAALGVIRIILENNVRIPLKPLFAMVPVKQIATLKAHEKLVEKTEARLQETHRVGKYLTVNETASSDIPDDMIEKNTSILLEFFHDRLKVQLKDQGIRHDVINAVVANGDDDLLRIVARAKAVQDFISSEDGVNLLAAYKRTANILTIAENKDGTTYHQAVVSSSLKEAEEKSLCDLLDTADKKVLELNAGEYFAHAMKLFAQLRTPVDRFFEKIMVNCEDAELRANRLRLLSQLRNTMNTVADFSLIESEAKDVKKAA